MNNFPITDTGTMSFFYRIMEEDQATELIKCSVTEDLYPESEMTLDPNTGNWFHKSKVAEYVDMQAKECGWNEEEVKGALEEFKQ